MLWIAVFALAASVLLGVIALAPRLQLFPRGSRSAGRAASDEPAERRPISLVPPAMDEESSWRESSWRAGVELQPALDPEEPTATFDFFSICHAARTDVGKKRPTNEDSYLCLPDAGVFAVADGMGGEAGGEIASAVAVTELRAAFEDEACTESWPVQATADLPVGGERLVNAICRANQAIRSAVADTPTHRGMGTTVVALHFAPRKNRVYVAHVGDSRAYRIRAGAVEQLTRDHTLSQVAGAKGGVGERLAWALGATSDITIDVSSIVPEMGDRLLLCSDGLTKLVSDSEILAITAHEAELEACARRLVDLANERGGVDNVTVVVTQVVPARVR